MGTTNPDYHRKLHREQRDDKRIPVRLDLRVGCRQVVPSASAAACRDRVGDRKPEKDFQSNPGELFGGGFACNFGQGDRCEMKPRPGVEGCAFLGDPSDLQRFVYFSCVVDLPGL
jgi:hypothetical protein